MEETPDTESEGERALRHEDESRPLGPRGSRKQESHAGSGLLQRIPLRLGVGKHAWCLVLDGAALLPLEIADVPFRNRFVGTSPRHRPRFRCCDTSRPRVRLCACVRAPRHPSARVPAPRASRRRVGGGGPGFCAGVSVSRGSMFWSMPSCADMPAVAQVHRANIDSPNCSSTAFDGFARERAVATCSDLRTGPRIS